METEPFRPGKPSTEKRLVAMLAGAAARLSALRQEPALVANCPNKFNDVLHDDQWYAVQVGRAYWEKYERITGYAEPHVGEEGKDYKKPEIKLAREILDDLLAQNWHAALGESPQGFRTSAEGGIVACLTIQHGQAWICSSYPVTDFGMVCTWTPDGRLVHMASCDRIDECIGASTPVTFEELRPDFWSFLTPGGRAYFRPSIRDGSAGAALCSLLRDAAGAATQITSERVLFRASVSSRPLWRCREADVTVKDGSQAEMAPLDAVLARLEKASWRKLFARAIGIEKEEDAISLVTDKGRSLAIWQNTAFDFATGSLKAVGLCDRWQWWDNTFWDTRRPVRLHPID